MTGWLFLAYVAVVFFGPKSRKSATWPAHGWVPPPAGSELLETVVTAPLPDGRPMRWRSHLYRLPLPTVEGYDLFIELQRSDGAYVTCTSTLEGIDLCRVTFMTAPSLVELRRQGWDI